MVIETEREGDSAWMAVAIDEAGVAARSGDVPVGCVVVASDGRELARGHNRREVEQDPTAHAEIVALRRAALGLGSWRLEGAIVYVTLEPCPMCAGALVNARVARVVFGVEDPKWGALVSQCAIGTDERLNHRFDWTGGVLREACLTPLQGFFRRLRAGGEK